MTGLLFAFIIFVIVILFLGIDRLTMKKNINTTNTGKSSTSLQDNKFKYFSYRGLAVAFVDAGLSLIGRTTPKTNNMLLTSESEKIREQIEKNFLDNLKTSYSDNKIYNILMKHFMLFKEAMLFQIFRTLLRVEEEDLYTLVYDNLTSRLSEGLTFQEAQEHHVYRTVFIRHFDDVLAQTQKTYIAIPASFWNTAIEKYPDNFSPMASLILFTNYFLCDVYLFTFDALEHSLKTLKDTSLI